MDRQFLLLAVVAVSVVNGLFSPFLAVAVPIAAVLMPEIFPRSVGWVLFFSCLLVASATLLFAGVPAALTERLAADGYKTVELRPTSALFCREPDDALEYALFQQGYRQELEIACALPLQKPYKALRADFSYNKRYDLKRAEKQGLIAAPLQTDDEIRAFHSLLCLNLQKFDATPVHTIEELLDLYRVRIPDEMSFLGVHDPSGELVAAACLFYFAQTNTLHTQYLATDTRITAYAPSSFLYDAVLREALRRGCAALSLGTCTHERGAVLNTGLILNKEGYGAGHSLNRIFTRKLV